VFHGGRINRDQRWQQLRVGAIAGLIVE